MGRSAVVFTVHAAKTNLSRLIARARAGETIVIARGRTPVVRLVAIDQPKAERRFGAMKGRSRTGRAFFDPLPSEELDPWST